MMNFDNIDDATFKRVLDGEISVSDVLEGAGDNGHGHTGAVEGDLVRLSVEEALTAIRRAPVGKKVETARACEVFRLLACLPDLEQEMAIKELAQVLDVRREVIRREIAAASPEAEEAPRHDPERGESFARELGENVLDKVVETVHALGVVGEDRIIKLAYLVTTSRVLKNPVSLVVKGVSSGGKSWTVENVLRLFPKEAFLARTGLSPHALAYSEENFSHRTLVVFEWEGTNTDEGSYLLRSLLSEGRLVYETVESTPTGLRPRVIEKEGPTNCIITTTRVSLHPENETRLITVNVDDSPAQTAAIFKRAAQGGGAEPELEGWRAFQSWLASYGVREVNIPYAGRLAELVPPVDVRLRRDFKALLSLIQAHALLHQHCRERDDEGRVVAALEDYAAVRELVADLLSYQLGQAVKGSIRETVEAVRELSDEGRDYVTLGELEKKLQLGKNAVARRVREALALEYVRDLNDGRSGKERHLILGEPLPEEGEILPSPGKIGGGGRAPENKLVFCDFPAQGAYSDWYNSGTPLVQVCENTNGVPTKYQRELGRLPGKSQNTNEEITPSPSPPGGDEPAEEDAGEEHTGYITPTYSPPGEPLSLWSDDLEQARRQAACLIISEIGFSRWFRLPPEARDRIAGYRRDGLITTLEAAELVTLEEIHHGTYCRN